MKNKLFKNIIYLVSLILLGLIILRTNRYQQDKQKYYKQYVQDNDTIDQNISENPYDIVYGSDNAPVTIVMYSSYNCVYCQKFFKERFPKLKRDYLDADKVKLIVKWIEQRQDKDMLFAVQALLCINQIGDIGPFHELILHQPEIVHTREFKSLIAEYAKKNSQVAQCITDNLDFYPIHENTSQFYGLNLKGTPTFIVGNKIFNGYTSYQVFRKIIEEALISN